MGRWGGDLANHPPSSGFKLPWPLSNVHVHTHTHTHRCVAMALAAVIPDPFEMRLKERGVKRLCGSPWRDDPN